MIKFYFQQHNHSRRTFQLAKENVNLQKLSFFASLDQPVVFDPVGQTYVKPAAGGQYPIEWQTDQSYEIFDSHKFDPDRPPTPNSPKPNYVTRKRKPKIKPVEPPRQDSPRPHSEAGTPEKAKEPPRSPQRSTDSPPKKDKTISEKSIHPEPQAVLAPSVNPLEQLKAPAAIASPAAGSGKPAFNTVFKGGLSKNGTWREGDFKAARQTAQAPQIIAPVAAPAARALPTSKGKGTGATKGKAKPRKVQRRRI